MANDNIFQQYLIPPKSIMEYSAEMDQADARRQSLQQNALTMAATQQKFQDDQRDRDADNHLSRLLRAGGTPDQVAAGLAQAGYGKQALAYTKQQQDLAKAKADADHLAAQTGKTKAETDKIAYDQREAKRQKAITDIAAFTDAQQAATSLKLHIAAGDIDPAQGQMIMQTIPQNPGDFAKWQIGMLQRIMAAKDSAGQIAPDANTVANNDRIRAEGQANRANQIKVQQMITERAESDDGSGLSDATKKRIAVQFVDAGDTSGMKNVGRGAQGAKDLRGIQNAITDYASSKGMSPTEISAKIADFEGLKNGLRTSANISARVENAISEAKELAPLAIAAGREVSRSGVLPFGKLGVMFNTQTNDPALKKFATANNGLVTAYAGAMARGQKPTQASFDHAQHILSEAQDQTSYEAAVNQLYAEMDAASRAPQNVRAHLREQISGSGAHGGAPAASSSTSSKPGGAKPSLTDIFGH